MHLNIQHSHLARELINKLLLANPRLEFNLLILHELKELAWSEASALEDGLEGLAGSLETVSLSDGPLG